MDREALVHRRKGRCLAQVLSAFEEEIEPHIPKGEAERFKGFVRHKVRVLAVDCVEIMSLEKDELNGIAMALRDSADSDAPIPSRRN